MRKLKSRLDHQKPYGYALIMETVKLVAYLILIQIQELITISYCILVYRWTVKLIGETSGMDLPERNVSELEG